MKDNELEILVVFSELDYLTDTYQSFLDYTDEEKYQGQFKDYAMTFEKQIRTKVEKLKRLVTR